MSNRFLYFVSYFWFGFHLVHAQESPKYKDENLSIEVRVGDLISRMTLEEKVSQLFNESPPIERLEIPAYNWWNECLHGVARAGKATVFPQAIGLAATFDEHLMFRIGDAISHEARAKHHYFLRNNARSIYMGLTFWTPNINIFRDPRWGRGQETYGEDPFLTSRMAVNFINGLQGNNPKYLKTIATAKHYAVHSGPEFTRHSDNNFVNDRDLYGTYLPAFKAAVKEANVQSVMCAYNRFRDKPCCGSDLLLSKILRNEFGFSGYVVSDCGAITDIYKEGNHHVVDSPQRALGWSLAAGTDLNCEESKAFIMENFPKAVETGLISENDIDIALTRLFSARFRLGMFDSPEKNPYANIKMDVVGSESHLSLALEAAEKSFVLLKNDGILPLRKGQRIAIIGPNADNMAVLLGNYNGDPIAPSTPVDALSRMLGNSVSVAHGAPLVPGVFTEFKTVPASVLFHVERKQFKPGLQADYYSDTELKQLKFSKVDKYIDFFWENSPASGVVDQPFSVKWSGVLVPETTGTFIFGGNVTLKIDGVLLEGKEILLEKGKRYALEVQHIAKAFWWSSNYQQQHAELLWVQTDLDYKKQAIDAARTADVVIFCGGISPNLEGEEMKIETEGFAHGDRTNIDLPPVQQELLRQVFEVNKHIVYVNFSGSAVSLAWPKSNIPAIIQAFYPGEATGLALARAIVGDANFSGRLPVTFYNSVDDLPAFSNYNMDGRTYRFFRGDVVFPFGFGLSYSKVGYKLVNAQSSVTIGDTLNIKVEVRNDSGLSVEEVVEVFASHVSSPVPAPITSLVSFQRVTLKPGESKIVTVKLSSDKFALLNSHNKWQVNSGTIKLMIGGSPLFNENKTGITTMLELRGENMILSE